MSCAVSVTSDLITHEIFVLQVLLESPEQSVVRDSEGSMQAGKSLNVGEWDIWTEIIDLEPDSERVSNKHSWSLFMQFRTIVNKFSHANAMCILILDKIIWAWHTIYTPLWNSLKGFCSWG